MDIQNKMSLAWCKSLAFTNSKCFVRVLVLTQLITSLSVHILGYLSCREYLTANLKYVKMIYFLNVNVCLRPSYVSFVNLKNFCFYVILLPLCSGKAFSGSLISCYQTTVNSNCNTVGWTFVFDKYRLDPDFPLM